MTRRESEIDPHIDGVIPQPMTYEEKFFLSGMLVGNLRRIYAASDDEGNDLSALPGKAADEIEHLHGRVVSMNEALQRVKGRVCGEKHPYWSDSQRVFVSRGFIADVCDMALLTPNDKAIEVTEFTDEDAADVGRALIKAIEVHVGGGWWPMDCPSEIVGDLCNERDELRAEVEKLKAIVKANHNCGCAITPCSHDCEFSARDLDAERYRKLRNDDNWGEDTCREGDSAWRVLGHLSGDAFDEFIDTRFALRGAA